MAAKGPTKRRNREMGKMSHRMRKLAVVIASAVLAGTIVMGTSPASADVGGCWGYCPGTTTWYDTPGGVTTNVTCTAGQITVLPSASVMSGYTNGQYISYRYNLQSNRGHNLTSGWAGWTLAPYSRQDQSVTVYTPRTQLPAARIQAARATTWTVQVQYVWYTGAPYAYSNWGGPTEGYRWSGDQRWYATCPT